MKKLKVVYPPFEGGAKIAAKRMSVLLLSQGLNCEEASLSSNKYPKQLFLNLYFTFFSYLNRFLISIYLFRIKTPWSLNFGSLSRYEIKKEKTLIHWLPGLFSYKDIEKMSKQVYIQFHDSWPLTGGCHVPLDCDKYLMGCESCPKLSRRPLRYTVAYLAKQLKRNALIKSNAHYCFPSNWLMKKFIKAYPEIQSDRLYLLRNAQNTRDYFFDEMLKKNHRSHRIILIGGDNAQSYSKGLHLLPNLFEIITSVSNTKIELAVVGGGIKFDNPNVEIFNLPSTKDERDMHAYISNSRLLIHLSLSENFSNTLIESLLSGTPVVAWNTSGNPEVVDGIYQKQFLAYPFNLRDFAFKIMKILDLDNEKYLIKSEEMAEYFKIRSNSDNSKIIKFLAC